MKKMDLVFVVLLPLNASVANSADFFDESSAPISEQEVNTFRGSGIESGAAANSDVVVIDDMLFRTTGLIESGFSGRKWTKGRFVYHFSNNVSEMNRSRFRESCLVWEQVSAVRCVPKSNGDRNYVLVSSSKFNRSYVGMIGGEQSLEVYNWNWKFIITHEIGHALGLSHEQSRSDRDKYVVIHKDNIPRRAINNFRIRRTANKSNYDFRSIMHYGATAFSINGGPTISPRPAYKFEGQHMGNRHYLSAGDAAGMARRYGR